MRDAWKDLLTMLLGVCLVAPLAAPLRAAESEVVPEAELVSEAEMVAELDASLLEEEATFLAAGDHGKSSHVTEVPAHGGGPDPLATDPDLAVWTLVVFLAMLAILSQVAWKPIMEALKLREANIGGAITSAQAKLAEAEGVLAKHQAELAGAADQVRELLAEAHRDAEATVAQAKADAKAEFAAERDRAMRDIDQAKDAAVRTLAERTAGLAIDLAGRVVKQEISPARQSEIVREALGRFGGNGPSAN